MTHTHDLSIDSHKLADDPLVLIVPGLNNSGSEHWQTLWENERDDCHRVDLTLARW